MRVNVMVPDRLIRRAFDGLVLPCLGIDDRLFRRRREIALV